ncbi:Hypothetical protein HDN1F_37680 [gamma proteobacterium HdN1]|nr:Hypothetical protein HDN1F_37680 [gamma proteobacterium HdN1]
MISFRIGLITLMAMYHLHVTNKKRVLMKKVLAVSVAALTLAACTKTVLWKSFIDNAELATAPLAIDTDATSATWQLYPTDTGLSLRKLDAKGVTLWSAEVAGDVQAYTGKAPELKTTSTGAVVAYNTGTGVFVKSFDANGSLLWMSDIGEHTSETVAAMVVGADDSVSLTIKTTGSKTNTLRLDTTGNVVWDKTMPTCTLIGAATCAPSLAINSDGLLVQVNATLGNAATYVIDSAGNTVWSKLRSTGVGTSGIKADPITFTTNGIVVTNAFATWEYDMSGNQRWSVGFGGTAPVAVDATGNLFVANGTKIKKLDANGVALTKLDSEGVEVADEIDLDGQLAISQLEWSEADQRLIVLSTYSNSTSVIIGKVTLNVGTSLWYFDATGKKIAKYASKPTVITMDACAAVPNCPIDSTVYGDKWTQFSTTSNKMVVMTGNVENESRYAVSYKLR